MNSTQVLASSALLASSLIASPASAVLSLGEKEMPVAVTFVTMGNAVLQNADDDTAREIVEFGGEHQVLPGSLVLITFDQETAEVKFRTAESMDPFWGQLFNYAPMEIDDAAIPAEGDGDIPYLGLYGPGGQQGSQYTTNSGLLAADLLPAGLETSVVQVEGGTGTIDCCDIAQQITERGAASPGGEWLDVDGDQLADVNIEDLLAASDIPQGQFSAILQAVPNPRDPCQLMDYMRGSCTPRSLTVAATHVLPLADLPQTEDCDLNGDDTFNLGDVQTLHSACKDPDVIPPWECDLTGDGEYTASDAFSFFIGCRGEFLP